MLRPRDVVWIYDETIRPPGPKMVMCIAPELGLFYRINTKPWRPAVLVRKASHPFLDHDSHLECGDPLEMDDYIISESLRRRGVIGRISVEICAEVVAFVRSASFISQADKDIIIAALNES